MHCEWELSMITNPIACVTSRPGFPVINLMKLCAIAAVLLLALRGSIAAETYKGGPGPFSVETLKLVWRDANREREVPAKIYYPKSATSSCPVIIFSHGLGGTRDSYEYLGRHWAGHGYLAVHLQHHGSDDAAWRGTTRPRESMSAAAMNVENSRNRPLDVSFALDQLTKLNVQDGLLRGRLDMERVGVAGHSFGAITTMAVAGQRFGPMERSLVDPRVKAAIAMSTPVPRRPPERNYAQIKIPILHMTGTEDDSPIGDTAAKDRRVPFDSIHGPPQFLVTFAGGDHMVFAGVGATLGVQGKDAAIHDLIRQSTTAFWDGYLREDVAAKNWLTNGGCKNALGERGVLEVKGGKPTR